MNDIRMAINTLKLANELSGIDKSKIDYMDNSHLYKANLTAISALEKQLNNGWIPVSERLPGDRKIVLQVTIKRLEDDYTWVQSLLWDYDKWKWWEEDDKKVDASRFKILAWQSLPEPYKEGQ